MNARLTSEDIKSAANARMFDVLAACGVHEKPCAGGYISMCDPVSKDRHPSLTIWTRGGFLTFKRHPGGPGRQGDVFDLVAYLKGWIDGPKRGHAEVCRFLANLLGLENVDRAQLERDRAASKRRAHEAEKKSGEERERNEGRAFKLWLDALPIIGTHADTYLSVARGIDLGKLPLGPRGGSRVPEILRALESHEHSESGQRLPCMIAGCVDFSLETPRIRAVHRTWLRPDGTEKAAVTPPRKVWPGFAGLVIPLWRGADNLSVGEAIKIGQRETLVLTEGVEDGLTAALADPSRRVWAMISLSNMANVPLPECVDGVIVHRQNDWVKPQAVAAFERGKRALEAQGVPVAEVAAIGGKDLNDTLRGE